MKTFTRQRPLELVSRKCTVFLHVQVTILSWRHFKVPGTAGYAHEVVVDSVH